MKLGCQLIHHNELCPNSPESPKTNVAVPVPDDLLTEDEGTGDDDIPPTETTVMPDVKSRQETLSPTP